MDKKILVGRRIKALRKQRKFSQEALANKAGTSAKYLSRIELGRENPTLDILLRLSDGLDVEPYELFSFEEGERTLRLRRRMGKLLDEVKDEEAARIVRILEAVMH